MARFVLQNPEKFVIKPGDTVFYQSPWNEGVVEGRVIIVTLCDNVTVEGITVPGVITLPKNRMFPSKDAALNALTAHNDQCRKAYENEIKTVQDLARFAFNHTVCRCEEYTDWNAREAYKNRAKDLLGIDLDD